MTENKELLKYEKSLINNSIALCNDDHIKICYCQNNFLENKKQELMYKEYEELRKTGEIEDQSVVNRRLSLANKKAFNAVANYCIENNIKCPIEHQVVKDIIDRFKNIEAYDLKDPKVYLIVKSVINQQLSAHRMQLFSSSKGIVQSVYDTNGNHRYILSPVEEAKRKADEAVVNAVEKLANMVEGQKFKTINESRVTVKFEDLLNEKDNRYVNLQEPIKFKFDNTPPIMKEQKDNS